MVFSPKYRIIPGVTGSLSCRRLTAFSLAVLMLLSVLLGSMHHHTDGHDHPDCSICAVAHHQPAASASIPAYIPPTPASTPTGFSTNTRIVISALRIASHSRAPPL
jgi:hypothetical protein